MHTKTRFTSFPPCLSENELVIHISNLTANLAYLILIKAQLEVFAASLLPHWAWLFEAGRFNLTLVGWLVGIGHCRM